MQRWINIGLGVGLAASLTLNALALRDGHTADTRLRANVPASFNPNIEEPRIGAGSYIDPLASVIGDVRMGRRVMVAPFASIRGDEGQPVRIGSRTNIQDGVVLHALETIEGGEPVEKNLVEFNGKKYAIYIGDEVSLAHQSQVHGPALVGDRTFIGMQALVFKAEIGEGSVVEPGAKVIGVKVAPGHYVPAGSVVTTQAQADVLPVITAAYAYKDLNDGVIHVNTQLADGYNGAGKVDHGEEPKKATHSTPSPATASGSHGAPAKAAPATSGNGHGAAAPAKTTVPVTGGGHGAATPAKPATPAPVRSATATPVAAATARPFPTAPAAGH